MASKRLPDNTSSSFPTMGDYLMGSLCNLSGQPSPYTRKVSKKTMGRGSSPTGKAAVRGRSMIREAHGPSFHISATLYEANAAESSATERNVKLMPAATPRSDRTGSASQFWSKRQYGQRS